MIKTVCHICFIISLCLALPACFEFFGNQNSDYDDEYDIDDDDDDISDICGSDGGVEEGGPAQWSGRECRVLKLVNQHRSKGADCGEYGSFGSTPGLSMQSNLQKAASLHSRHMGENNYFSHDSPRGPNGDNMKERIENAGYLGWRTIGENISAGFASAEETVDGWMNSPGHCANIMSHDFTQIGIGYAQVNGSEYTHYWTQDFGAR